MTPIQDLLDHEEVEHVLRQETMRSFGSEFVLRRAVGKTINVHWGTEPTVEHGTDRVSRSYLEQLGRLPLLDAQGDGVRSFLGTLLCLALARELIVTIDEPEAFLHPPQEFRLGELVGALGRGRQVFIATHSSAFLQGVMDERCDDLVVIHLRRDGDLSRPQIIHGDRLKKTWADPGLRYGRILDGLFHDLVVLCESEDDCRLYHAAFDYSWKSSTSDKSRKPTVLFAHVGGKTGFPGALAALSAFGIPTRVIADFDVLNAESVLSKAVQTLGSDWSAYERDWKVVHSAIENKGSTQPRVGDVLKAVSGICTGDPNRRLDKVTSKALADKVAYSGSWNDAKRAGRSFLPSGDATVAFDQLTARLAQIGILVVPVGELECWVRDVGGKGAPWLTTVFAEIESGQRTYPAELVEFVARAVGSAPPRTGTGPSLLAVLGGLSRPSTEERSPDMEASRSQEASVNMDDPDTPNVGNPGQREAQGAATRVTLVLVFVAVVLSVVAILRTL